MKILITGGAGFLGSHLTDALLARGHEVIVLDPGADFRVRHHLNNPSFQLVPDSVFNETMLEALVLRADLIYHLAAIVGVEHYVADPFRVLQVNINGTQNVLKLAHKHNKRVVFSSTSEVYGRNPRPPFDEDDDRVLGSVRKDRWCYATSKAAAEHICLAYRNLGLKVTIVRYFNIYGPRLDCMDKGRVITIFLGQILRGEPVTIIGDGRQTRSFTYVEDSTRATLAAGFLPEAVGGIFNIGHEKETSILELAQTMIRLDSSRSTIRFVNQEEIYDRGYEDIPRRIPNITRMKTILGVTPQIGLEEGLRRTISWFRKETTSKETVRV
jgi:UDP-glucose 4-epimerase